MKSLRTRAREILDCVDRGKPRARLASIAQEISSIETRSRNMPVFGMWGDREDITDVDSYVRETRKALSGVN